MIVDYPDEERVESLERLQATLLQPLGMNMSRMKIRIGREERFSTRIKYGSRPRV